MIQLNLSQSAKEEPRTSTGSNDGCLWLLVWASLGIGLLCLVSGIAYEVLKFWALAKWVTS